jgi:hypothetical protein
MCKSCRLFRLIVGGSDGHDDCNDDDDCNEYDITLSIGWDWVGRVDDPGRSNCDDKPGGPGGITGSSILGLWEKSPAHSRVFSGRKNRHNRADPDHRQDRTPAGWAPRSYDRHNRQNLEPICGDRTSTRTSCPHGMTPARPARVHRRPRSIDPSRLRKGIANVPVRIPCCRGEIKRGGLAQQTVCRAVAVDFHSKGQFHSVVNVTL